MPFFDADFRSNTRTHPPVFDINDGSSLEYDTRVNYHVRPV